MCAASRVKYRQCPKPSRDGASLAFEESRHTCSGDESSHPTTDTYESDNIVITPSTPPQQDSTTMVINALACSSQRERQPSVNLRGNVERNRDGNYNNKKITRRTPRYHCKRRKPSSLVLRIVSGEMEHHSRPQLLVTRTFWEFSPGPERLICCSLSEMSFVPS